MHNKYSWIMFNHDTEKVSIFSTVNIWWNTINPHISKYINISSVSVRLSINKLTFIFLKIFLNKNPLLTSYNKRYYNQ